jgi:exodeoxyribonuclease VII small subunit
MKVGLLSTQQLIKRNFNRAMLGQKGKNMKQQTFEEKLAQSKAILERLMDPEVTLEESVKLYEEGLATIKAAQTMIDEAKLKVEIIEKNQSGVEG